MTEWTVVGVLVVLVGLGVSIVTPIIKLNSTIVRLSQLVERCSTDLRELTDRNSRSHDRIFSHLEEHDHTLNDHETRISILEGAKK